ncbi:MAG: DEAD/DEAH box helicase [Polyangiaceae bacterium]|jgi:ATP-dependent RNA helicase DeaD|nr:DEAD/DEAH box helicase [Polyangiaceae bacterium]
MSDRGSLDLLVPPLREALLARGITSLTEIQQSVLAPELDGLDLRIRSRTGSGKTVATGLVLAPLVERVEGDGNGPLALVIVPTRELAAQIQGELAWLMAGLKVKTVAVTGGTSVPMERRQLASSPEIVVGTPGRLLDHLNRGAIDPSSLRAVVLDEADQMLDLGFRDDLEAILAKLPEERQTHMVSATFSGPILELASAYQRDPVLIEAGRAGAAHEDIEFVAHLVLQDEREDALVNLLLAAGDERALVFVRTRAQTGEVAAYLGGLGFTAAPLNGDMEQRERTRTLEAFRSGRLQALIATDVAARGIDVADVALVVHLDLPGDAEALTHRSGRTGRAGKKGRAVVMVPPQARGRAAYLFQHAGIRATWNTPPGPGEVATLARARLESSLAELTASDDPSAASFRPLAEKLLAGTDPAGLLAAMLARMGKISPCEPRTLTPIATTKQPRGPRPAQTGSRQFKPFVVTWGSRHGADPRRVLALVCRRGGIQGGHVGAIDIGPTRSCFEIDISVAEAFAQAASRPDERDPRVRIAPMDPTRAPGSRPSYGPPRPPYREPERPAGPAMERPPRRFKPRDA